MFMLLVLICCFTVVPTFGTTVNSCPQGILPNVSFSIKSQTCDSTPCDIILGCPATISVDFQAPKYLENMKPQILATYAGVQLDYPLFQDDACKGFTNTQCPIVEKEHVNYQYTMNLAAIFPEVQVNLKFSIRDKDLNEDIVCFIMDIQVKKTECPSN